MGIKAVLFAAAAAGLLLATGLRGSAGPLATQGDMQRAASANATEVDAELVLAVDISYSMDPDEQALQREGYVHALTSPEFLNALKGNMLGRVAITYVEWAGVNDQRIVMPWRLIDGAASAAAVAREILNAPYRRAYRTSIAGALRFSASLFAGSGYRGLRRIIDVSGDGANNQGPLVTLVRDDVLSKGITINGLPIMLKRPNLGWMDIENLDVYYEDCVIGGPGSFVVAIHDREEFKKATRTKLVQEVADNAPARIVRVDARAPRVSCTVGERMWQDRWGGGMEGR
jgi:hypothetical protein